MARRAITISGAPAPAGPYSQGIVANGLLFTAGFGPQDPLTGRTVDGGVFEQTEQVLRNVAQVLDAHNLGLEHVVKVTAHLQDLHRDFGEFNRAYSAFFAEPYPARTTVGSELSDILIEIDVVAALPDR